MKVSEVMNLDVASCPISANLEVPAQLMWDRRVGSVVILDGERPVGVVTDRDVAMGAQTQGKLLNEIPVRTTMSAELSTCGPGEEVGDVLRRMAQRKIRRCPVVDGETGRLIGLLSLDDLASAAVRNRGWINPRHLAAAFAASAMTGESPQTPEPSRAVPARAAALAGEVGHQVKQAWDQVRSTIRDLQEERPDRGPASRVGSRLVRALSRRPRVIRRKAEQPPGNHPPQTRT
jgi:CBS domain-containing protein